MQYFSLRISIVTIVCLSTSFLVAAPEEDESKPQDIFQQLDKNSDGIVTADEVPEGKKRFFDHLIRSGDDNQDGKLSQAEFQSGLKKENQKFPEGERSNRKRGPQALQMLLKRLDKNEDQKISKDELPEPLRDRLGPLFERLNKEELSLDEFKQHLRQFRGSRDANKKQENSKGETRTNSERAERFFNTLDTNKDGKLSLEEAPERGKQILRRILERSGKEADSQLSKKEFLESIAAFRPSRRPQGRDGDKEFKRPEMRNKETDRQNNSPKRRSTPALMKALDSNQDGMLSKDELKKMGQVFDRLDQNNDGSLDLSELWGRRDRSASSDRKSDEPGRNRSRRGKKKTTPAKEGIQQ